jgi:hypothetical protein
LKQQQQLLNLNTQNHNNVQDENIQEILNMKPPSVSARHSVFFNEDLRKIIRPIENISNKDKTCSDGVVCILGSVYLEKGIIDPLATFIPLVPFHHYSYHRRITPDHWDWYYGCREFMNLGILYQIHYFNTG